jgi:hypothetical protein
LQFLGQKFCSAAGQAQVRRFAFGMLIACRKPDSIVSNAGFLVPLVDVPVKRVFQYPNGRMAEVRLGTRMRQFGQEQMASS